MLPRFHSDGAQVVNSSLTVVFAAAAILAATDAAVAADRTISAQTKTFDCSSVEPGDTLTLASGARGPLKIRNCNGTQAKRIIIRNDPQGTGPTVIRRASGSDGGFIFHCANCIGVEIDGSYKWRNAPATKTYGIKVTITEGAGPSAFIKFSGLFRFVTIRNVEVDGAWPALAQNGSGIRMIDLTVDREAHAGLWHEGILLENNYLHDIALEGMYVGGNYNDGDLPLRNVEVRYNRIEDTGYEGINTKSTWTGDNSIHHNRVRRVGKNTANTFRTAEYAGIKNNAGNIKIYSNWVETTGQAGIVAWTRGGPKISESRGPFEARIWNNVIVNAGALWRPFMTNKRSGISVGAQDGCEKPVPFIYNNTIVSSREGAIVMTNNVNPGFVRDNILAGSGSNAVIIVPRFVDLINNRVGATELMGFVDPSLNDFHLKIGSPARNAGSNVFPDNDFDGVPRPQEGSADQGAFEGNGS